ncbi:hypothetical protein Ancab_012634 [Ancistrocladus abbreviatus]
MLLEELVEEVGELAEADIVHILMKWRWSKSMTIQIFSRQLGSHKADLCTLESKTRVGAKSNFSRQSMSSNEPVVSVKWPPTKLWESGMKKQPFHLHSGWSTSYILVSRSGLVCSGTSQTTVGAKSNFSTQSMSTNEPVVSVEWLEAKLREHDRKSYLPSTIVLSTASLPLISSRTVSEELIKEVGEQAEAGVVRVLMKWGCSKSEITKIFSRQPALRKADSCNLESKLSLLSELGLNSSDLVKIIHCRPRFLSCRLNRYFDERLGYLESMFESREVLLKAIIRNPSLLTYDVHKIVKPVISLYEQMGISRKDLVPMLISRPTLIPRTKMNEEKLRYIQRTGVPKESKMYKYVVTIIGISRVETIREKVANLEKFGFSEDEVLGLIGRSPLLLTLSIDKIQRNMTFIMGTMQLPAKVVIDYPFLLYSSLEALLKPRLLLARKIEDMGLVPQIKGAMLLRALRMTEKRFLKVFVTCHPKDVMDELLGWYRNAKCVRRLAETSKKIQRKGFPF